MAVDSVLSVVQCQCLFYPLGTLGLLVVKQGSRVAPLQGNAVQRSGRPEPCPTCMFSYAHICLQSSRCSLPGLGGAEESKTKATISMLRAALATARKQMLAGRAFGLTQGKQSVATPLTDPTITTQCLQHSTRDCFVFLAAARVPLCYALEKQSERKSLPRFLEVRNETTPIS